MIFKSQEHKDFFYDRVEKTRDCYYQSFFYVAGLSEDTRNYIEDIFDFNENRINPEGLSCSWQTSGTRRITLMAFNLWNGYAESGCEEESTPYELFADSNAEFFIEAIRLHFSEYM